MAIPLSCNSRNIGRLTFILQVVEEVLGDHLVDDQAGLAEYLGRMGRLHEKQGVSRRSLDALGPCLIRAIRPILQVGEKSPLIQRSAKVFVRGLVKFVPALA